ncbi:MAG: TlpA family protein disulfide reductase [Oscillospiraceae bacterium]|nr:TlpA family protein disulfide reductase [Oscillospiraceae bacterium]
MIVTLLVLVIIIGGGVLLYRNLGQNIDLGEAIPTETAPQNLAPDFTVTDGAGNEVKLSDFRGKGVVLNFWASWCGPCKMEMPDFEAKCKELEGDVVFMMVNATDGGRETVDTAKQFVADSGYSFPVYYDTEYSAIYAYGVNAFPTTFFIDAEGHLVAYGQGAMSGETLQTGIDMIFEG